MFLCCPLSFFSRIILKFNGFHKTSVSIGVHIFFTIPTHVFSTHVILGLPFLVRDDFVTLLTFITFLAHGLAVSVRSTVVDITVSSCQHSVRGTAFSPGCFQCNSETPLCKTAFAYLDATMFLFRIVLFRAF